MGFYKGALAYSLEELQIGFSQYEHPGVWTLETQAKYVGDKGGSLSKNLFLKDKKSRFYIVSALADRKVDLKVLSQRLGLGKGGTMMALEEALSEILQFPKRDLQFLAALVRSDSFALSDPLENTTPLHAPAANPISDKKFTAATVKATKSQFVAQDSKDNGASYSKDMTLLHLEITGDTIGQRGEHFGIEVANCIMKRLGPDLKSLATMFKNTTYAQGFYAGAHHQPKQL